MALTIGKPYEVVRTGLSATEKLIYHVIDGSCTALAVDQVIAGPRSGLRSEKMAYHFGDQKVNADGTLIIGKPYEGLRAGLRSEKLVYLIARKSCTSGTPNICDCDVCCTLSAIVQVGNGVKGDPWSAPTNVTLTCGGEMNVSCSGDDTSLLVTTTYSEKDIIGSPEAYSSGGASGTRECKTGIWSSGTFTIDGESYRLSYWRSGGTVYQTSPSVTTTNFCVGGWMLQHQANDGSYGNYWETIAGTDLADWVNTNSYGWLFDVTVSPAASCTSDLVISTGCDKYTGTYTSVIDNAAGSATECPVYLHHSSRYRLTSDSDVCSNYYKCANVSIADACGPLSCSLFESGADYILDYVVTGCHDGSGSDTWTGTDCGDEYLFAAGTANIFEGANTDFGTGDPGGGFIEFLWCNAESTSWYSDANTTTVIEFALVCNTRDDGTTYLAFYALLSMTCYTDFVPTGSLGWAYKTQDLAYTLDGRDLIISVTGLTPFASQSAGTGCTCDPPTISLAFTIRGYGCD